MYELIIFCVLLAGGFLFGRIAEKRHFKSLVKRELESNALPAIASKYPPEDESYQQHLVTGGVVIASDYFKSFTAGLINIFGGRVTPFESLLDRGRREAILRMKDNAREVNADFIFNVKLETSRIATGRVGAIEVLAYGTALVPIGKRDANANTQGGGVQTTSLSSTPRMAKNQNPVGI